MVNTREKRPLCFYFIQGEQGESPNELNVFEVGGDCIVFWTKMEFWSIE